LQRWFATYFFYTFVIDMGTLLYKLQVVKRWLKSYISPAFILLFCASFVFWYILKLGNTYTTEYNILVNVDGQTLRIPSVVEGVGTNLLGYRNYTRKEIKLRLSDLKYRREEMVDEATGEQQICYVLDPQSVHNAISVRFSDIKIVSLGDIPPIITTDSADVAAEERAASSSVVAKIVKLLKRDKGSAATSNADSI
jgi:hypothetical protein